MTIIKRPGILTADLKLLIFLTIPFPSCDNKIVCSLKGPFAANFSSLAKIMLLSLPPWIA
jgi:hypothetical protein